MAFSSSASDQCVVAVQEPYDTPNAPLCNKQFASTLGFSADLLPDERLVRECLAGDEDAWSRLIDRYRRFIFSIPIKYGFSRDDAAEVFQQVCFRLLSELKRLREPCTLPAWLMKVTVHECALMAKQRARYVSFELDDFERGSDAKSSVLEQVQEEQQLRDAIAKLNDRCRRLIGMLFFTSPALPYDEVARSLGVAKGSVGFIRMRCIERIRKAVDQANSRPDTVLARKAS